MYYIYVNCILKLQDINHKQPKTFCNEIDLFMCQFEGNDFNYTGTEVC